jgi:hypothetical protein
MNDEGGRRGRGAIGVLGFILQRSYFILSPVGVGRSLKHAFSRQPLQVADEARV